MTDTNVSSREVQEEWRARHPFTYLTLGILRFFSVPQGYACLIVAFGKCVRVAVPGLGFCVSFWGLYQKPKTLVPTKEEVDNYKEDTIFTKDGVKCALDAAVFYRINDPVKATFEIENYQSAIQSLVKAILRNECGKLAARELLSSREELSKQIREGLNGNTEPWGISVRLVEIQGIDIGS